MGQSCSSRTRTVSSGMRHVGTHPRDLCFRYFPVLLRLTSKTCATDVVPVAVSGASSCCIWDEELAGYEGGPFLLLLVELSFVVFAEDYGCEGVLEALGQKKPRSLAPARRSSHTSVQTPTSTV